MTFLGPVKELFREKNLKTRRNWYLQEENATVFAYLNQKQLDKPAGILSSCLTKYRKVPSMMCEAPVTINIGGGRVACFSRLFFHDPHLGRMERILRKCLMWYWLEERNSNHFLKPCRYTPTMSLYRTKGLVCRGKGGRGL